MHRIEFLGHGQLRPVNARFELYFADGALLTLRGGSLGRLFRAFGLALGVCGVAVWKRVRTGVKKTVSFNTPGWSDAPFSVLGSSSSCSSSSCSSSLTTELRRELVAVCRVTGAPRGLASGSLLSYCLRRAFCQLSSLLERDKDEVRWRRDVLRNGSDARYFPVIGESEEQALHYARNEDVCAMNEVVLDVLDATEVRSDGAEERGRGEHTSREMSLMAKRSKKMKKNWQNAAHFQ